MANVLFLMLALALTLSKLPKVTGSKMYYGVNEEALEILAQKEFALVQEIWTKEKNLTSSAQQETPKKLQKIISKYVEDIYMGIPSETTEEQTGKENFLRREPLSDSWINKTIFDIATNPLSSFRMIFRIREKLPRLLKQTQKVWGLNLTDRLPKVLPDTDDEENTMQAILKGQLLYKIRASELAKGNFPNGISTGATLSAIHCHNLGMYAVAFHQFVFAVEWLFEAYKMVEDRTSKDTSIKKTQVVGDLEDFFHEHNVLWSKLKPDEPEEDFPLSQRFDSKITINFWSMDRDKIKSEILAMIDRFYERMSSNSETKLKNFPKSKEERAKLSYSEKDAYFDFVCTGNNFQSNQERSKLFCWYEWKKNLFYLIGPMKMEFLAMDPDLVRIYDVIGPKNIQRIEREAAGKYGRAFSKLTLEDKIVTIPESASKPGMQVQPKFSKINLGSIWVHNIYVTKLVTPKTGDKIPRSNIDLFTFGGMFSPHVHDDPEENKYKSPNGGGQHFAMTYLSNVRLGGHTGFPIAGVSVEPIAGSTLIWYDLHSDGSHDPQMFHGGCLVFLGKKLTNTRSHDYYDQFLHYKCPKKRGERYKTLVNGKEPW